MKPPIYFYTTKFRLDSQCQRRASLMSSRVGWYRYFDFIIIKIESKWSPESMCIVDRTMDTSRTLEYLRPMGTARPSQRQSTTKADNVCRTINHSLLLPDGCSLRLFPQREPLPRLASHPDVNTECTEFQASGATSICTCVCNFYSFATVPAMSIPKLCRLRHTNAENTTSHCKQQGCAHFIVTVVYLWVIVSFSSFFLFFGINIVRSFQNLLEILP